MSQIFLASGVCLLTPLQKHRAFPITNLQEESNYFRYNRTGWQQFNCCLNHKIFQFNQAFILWFWWQLQLGRKPNKVNWATTPNQTLIIKRILLESSFLALLLPLQSEHLHSANTGKNAKDKTLKETNHFSFSKLYFNHALDCRE